MKVLDRLKDFFGRQSRNYKVTVVRNSLDRLFTGGGGPGMGGPLARARDDGDCRQIIIERGELTGA